MELGHTVNRLMNKAVLIDQPSWRGANSLDSWHQGRINKAISDILETDSDNEVEIWELFEKDAVSFSKLMKSAIKDFTFISKIQKWISYIIRSPWYYNSLRLKDDAIILSAKNEKWETVWGIEVKIKVNPHNEKYAYISWLAVTPKFREKKIWTILLKKLEKLLTERGIMYTISAVHKDNMPSIKAHEKFWAGIHSNYYDFHFFAKKLRSSK